MCIIIHKPAGATLALSTVLHGYQRNDDGWGMIARTPEGLVVRRDFGRDADLSLIDTYAELQQHELTIHCRIGTSGDLSIINTHPFNVTGDTWLFHNGVIDIARNDKRYCDTYHVAASFRSVFETEGVDATELIRSPEYAAAMAAFAKTSKLVFVDPLGIVIVNEQAGFWEDGCWFSNASADSSYVSPYTWTSAATGAASRLYDRDGCDYADDVDLDDEDELAYQEWLGEREDYARPIKPRCDRVETADDEDRLYMSTLAFIGDLQKLDVDEIAERCFEQPEIAAEALSVLLQERRYAATLTTR